MIRQRKQMFWVALLLLLIVGQALTAGEALAKKGSRRSYSSRKSSSKGSSFGNSQRKSYSSRTKKGSAFNVNAKKTSRGTSFAEASQRAQSQSKFRSSAKGAPEAKTYKQVVTENPALAGTLNTEAARTRDQRRQTYYASAPRANTYYQYAPAVRYYDPFDNTFFQFVTLTWMFHHWDQIDRQRFDAARLHELEAQVAELEAQGLKRDPNYTMPGVEPDVQYDDQELANLQDAKEVAEIEQDASEGGFSWLTMFLMALAAMSGIYFTAVRRY